MPAAISDAARHIEALAESASNLAQRGEREEAEKVYRSILEAAPFHVAALIFLAGRALERGEISESRRLLEQAVKADPQDPRAYQNLGIVYRDDGDLDLALEAFNRALALKPVAPLALLHKGRVLEDLGRQQEALACYRSGLGYLPSKPESLVNDPDTPPKVRDLIAHGMAFSRQRFETVIAKHLAPVETGHDSEELAHVHAAVRWLGGGSQAPAFVHALQRPEYLYLPDVEPRACFERAEFDWVPALEASFPAIRAELQTVLTQRNGVHPYVQIEDGTDPQQWHDLNHSDQWSAFRLLRRGRAIPENSSRCPATMEALRRLPLPNIPGHAPEAIFSLLAPGAHIPSHYGLGNYKLTVHLPLIVPPDCSIRVGHQTRTWTEGQCLIFDDSFQHEAWNRSRELRVVLITEIWNPLLTAADREGVTALIAALREFDGGTNRELAA